MSELPHLDMPDTCCDCCDRCGVAGFVRRERIITGLHVEVEYTCGVCDHAWRAADARKRVDRRRVARGECSRRTR